MSLTASWLVRGVRLYQAMIRPIAGCHCRFHPSCSDFGIEALQRHGVIRGVALTSRRILRCNPWVPGGYDPVPAAAPLRRAKLAR